MKPYINQIRYPRKASRTEILVDVIGSSTLRVLDVGNLGDGIENIPLFDIVTKNGGEYYGLDSNENLALARKIPGQVVGDIHEAPFEDNYFDVLYLGEVLEHSWRPALMLRECNRILRFGGRIVLDTPNVYSFYSIVRYLSGRETLGASDDLLYAEAKNGMKHLREEGVLLMQPQHKVFYSPTMLRGLLMMHGFSADEWFYVEKHRGLVRRIATTVFPQLSQKISCVASKKDLDGVFSRSARE